jgi:hypothetical protein
VSIVVFTGPSLSPESVRSTLPGALVRGPVACGDVYRSLRDKPTVIALIDGYFDQRLSVWHKEILWALSGGIRVLGCSSMGALRAVELAHFGMQGVGRIFEWYRDGVIEDDDEVALTHEPAERGYAPASEPMVNIRATLLRAQQLGVLSEASAELLAVKAKHLFYPERRWPTVVGASGTSVDPHELEKFVSWLRGGNRVDQKRLDALELLEELRRLSPQPQPNPPGFVFEYTEAWHALKARLDRETGGDALQDSPGADRR